MTAREPERRLPPAAALRRLWMMLTHYHGQNLNASDLGRSLELSPKTIRRYIEFVPLFPRP